MIRRDKNDDLIATVQFLSVVFLATVILGYVFLALVGLVVGRG